MNTQEHAKNIRKNIIKMVGAAGSGHPGGSLSMTDIVSVLYFEVLNIDPKNPKWEKRDRLVLSKGHAAPGLYAALAERGYYDEEELLSLRKFGSKFQGHPDMKKVPGVDMSTGSLGQGLSAANGMAIASKLKGVDNTIYCIMGDGEVQEGMIWEAAMSAAHYKLDNLVGIIDLNGLQIDGSNDEVMRINPIDEKFKAFGWNVLVIDGHNYDEIRSALAKSSRVEEKPTVIIAKTVKGRGVSFMENNVNWHGSAPKGDQIIEALKEIEEER